MKLKEYQDRALKEVKSFLEQLVAWRKRAAENPDLKIDFAAKAWEKAEVGRACIPKHDCLGRPLPMFCLKIPTGGGKTLMAVKTIDHVQNLYLQRQTGLVVWIVPTQQIYRQTLTRLADRDDSRMFTFGRSASCKWSARAKSSGTAGRFTLRMCGNISSAKVWRRIGLR